jgi:hypothetical protein
MSFLLRTRVAPASLGQIAERTLWSTGRLMNVYRIMPLEQVVDEGRWQSRFTMILLTLFAALALILPWGWPSEPSGRSRPDGCWPRACMESPPPTRSPWPPARSWFC